MSTNRKTEYLSRMRTRHFLPSFIALTLMSTPVFAADELPTIIVSEPVQYVPQHDKCAYFTPGICTRMKGEIRARLVLPGEFDELTIDPMTNAIGLSSTGGQSYESRVRGRFEFEAIRDLEPGELKSKLRLQAESKSPRSGDASAVVDQAYIELRPLFVGYSDSAWVMTTNDGDTGFGGFGIFDGAYGDQQRNLIQFQVNDLTDNRTFFAISLEDDGDMTSWTPDLVARAGIDKSTSLFAVVGYDQDNGVTSAVWNALGGAPLGLGSAELGFELGLRTDIADAHRLHLQGFYATGNTAYNAELAYLGVNWTPPLFSRWSVMTRTTESLRPSGTRLVAHRSAWVQPNWVSNSVFAPILRTRTDYICRGSTPPETLPTTQNSHISVSTGRHSGQLSRASKPNTPQHSFHTSMRSILPTSTRRPTPTPA